MKSTDVINLLNKGVQPYVFLKKRLWEDSWGMPGMIARIVSFTVDTDGDDESICFVFDYKEFKIYNLSLKNNIRTCLNDNTLSIDLEESVFFGKDGEDSDIPVELADNAPILKEYIKSESDLSYTKWLEDFIEKNVPECMKPWSKI